MYSRFHRLGPRWRISRPYVLSGKLSPGAPWGPAIHVVAWPALPLNVVIAESRRLQTTACSPSVRKEHSNPLASPSRQCPGLRRRPRATQATCVHISLRKLLDLQPAALGPARSHVLISVKGRSIKPNRQSWTAETVVMGWSQSGRASQPRNLTLKDCATLGAAAGGHSGAECPDSLRELLGWWSWEIGIRRSRKCSQLGLSMLLAAPELART